MSVNWNKKLEKTGGNKVTRRVTEPPSTDLSFIRHILELHLLSPVPHQSDFSVFLRFTMILLESMKKLSVLAHLLQRDLPHSITVYGGLQHIRNNNPFNMEVCVDSWPDFRTVVLRRQRQFITDDNDAFSNPYAIFAKEPEQLKRMLLEFKVIDWKQSLLLYCISGFTFDILKEVADAKDLTLENFTMPSKIFIHHNPEIIEDGWFHKSSKLSSDTTFLAELINKNTKYCGSEQSLNYIKKCIELLPSAYILDDEGHFMGWCLTDELSTFRMGYILPEFRNKGYMKRLVTNLAKLIHQRGHPAYTFVTKSNTISQLLCKSLGMTEYPHTYYYLKMTPRKSRL
ncbi:glycine N-acyltransferase-like protein 3 [Polypterus senegalus]|nr:glycine N-acyltransferase-like protein 3 [Polypterus senegalus]